MGSTFMSLSVVYNQINQKYTKYKLLWHWDYTVPHRVSFVNLNVAGSHSTGYLLTS